MSFNVFVTPKQKGEKMINKVSFTGRETMLTQKVARPVEQQVIKASTYIEEVIPRVFEEAPKASVESLYTSPFASTSVKNVVSENVVNRTGLDFFG